MAPCSLSLSSFFNLFPRFLICYMLLQCVDLIDDTLAQKLLKEARKYRSSEIQELTESMNKNELSFVNYFSIICDYRSYRSIVILQWMSKFASSM